ncbi:MAG: hypothetical protein V3S62_04595 [Acidimicrobiia bacterium]
MPTIVSGVGDEEVVGIGSDVAGPTPCAPAHADSQSAAVTAIVGRRPRRRAGNLMDWISGVGRSGIRN